MMPFLSLRWVKISMFFLILVFYASLILHPMNLPEGLDLPRQIKNGETLLSDYRVLYENFYSYTEPNHQFVNHHWLSGVVFYLIHQVAGFGGLSVFAAIVLLSAFSILFFTSLKKADFWLVALFSLPTLLILQTRTMIRPEIFSYFFMAIYIYLLADFEEHPERKRIFWLIPLQALWVNMHIFFSVGLIITSGFLIQRIVLKWKNLKEDPIVRKLIFLLTLLILVSFINPNGIKGFFYSYEQWRIFPNFPLNIIENQSIGQILKNAVPDISIPTSMFAAALFGVSLFFSLKRKPVFYALMGFCFAVIGFFVVRGLSLFAIIFLPAVSANFNDFFSRALSVFEAHLPWVKKAAGAIFAVVLMAIFSYLIFASSAGKILRTSKLSIGLTPHSNGSADFFKENNLKGPIFNDADIGSYLIYHLFPEEKVFTDNRFGDAYSNKFFETYLAMLGRDDAWQHLSEKYNFNVLFLYRYDKASPFRDFLWRRIRDPEWALIYSDTYSLIFVENTPQNQDIIEKFKITRENAGERLKFLVESDSADDMIAAADVFNLLGREDLGTKTFLDVVMRWPERSRIWMTLGKWEVLRKDPRSPTLAMMFLERAILEGQKTAEAYSALGSAYFKMGQIDKAEQALKRALRINPDREEAKTLLKNIQDSK